MLHDDGDNDDDMFLTTAAMMKIRILIKLIIVTMVVNTD